MLFDQMTLFMAAAISCTALAAALVSAWLVTRRDGFLLAWGIGILLCGAGTTFYLTVSGHSLALGGGIGFSVDLAGFAVILAASGMFLGHARPWRLSLALGVPGIVAIMACFALGLTGLGTIVLNVMAGVMLVLTGLRFWRLRPEAPVSLTAISSLYWLTALSFFCCAGVVVATGPIVLAMPPDNWAEMANAVASIVGITMVGAFSLALNQSRAARRHRKAAETDSLTGLTNRRALFDRFAARPLDAMTAVTVFDLDRFKAINDGHGHSVGDEVLRRFAALLADLAGPSTVAARIGGEEFVLVTLRTDAETALAVAETVRARFAQTRIVTGQGALSPTVSAGVAFAESDGQDFQAVLIRADRALYGAKSEGRDRVATPHRVA